MKKNDLFIDVSSHNGYDITGILADIGTQNTIIKISESTSYINPCLSAQIEQSIPVGFYHFAGLVVTLKKPSVRHVISLIMFLKK